MPVGFLTQEQRDGFGRYVDPPSREELERYFHLSDDDHKALLPLRGEHNRLGYATQLTSVRYLGTFPEDFSAVPDEVLQALSRQLGINDPTCILAYAETRQRQQLGAQWPSHRLLQHELATRIRSQDQAGCATNLQSEERHL